ncbi:MAG TPA: hypothetical protein VI704_08285, partial [Bacteroidota bacterium]|nr:hypothetical protein [Bacteroidota bacterium]
MKLWDFHVFLVFVSILGVFFESVAVAQDSTLWKLDIGGTFSTFQQQVKAEVGEPRGERLVNETQVGVMLMGT